MKKIAFCILSTTLLTGSVQQAQAIKTPISTTKAVLGTIGVCAGTGALFEALFGWPTNSFVESPSLSKARFPFVVGIIQVAATWAGWKLFSKYTAQGYYDRAHAILHEGVRSKVKLLTLLACSKGDTKQIADAVIDHFSARRNELAKSVIALERLFGELSLANYYFDKARTGSLNEINMELAVSSQEIIAEVIGKIKAVSLEIKSNFEYEKQYQDELQEMKVSAQCATAEAIRDAGYQSNLHAHYVYNG